MRYEYAHLLDDGSKAFEVRPFSPLPTGLLTRGHGSEVPFRALEEEMGDLSSSLLCLWGLCSSR